MNNTPPTEQPLTRSTDAESNSAVRHGVMHSMLTFARAWDLVWVGVLLACGVGALLLAIFTLDGLMLAFALVAIPGALIGWCMVKAMYWDIEGE